MLTVDARGLSCPEPVMLMLDAIGKTIDKIHTAQKNTAEDYRAERVLFVIITDGAENASRRYSSMQVKEMIRRQKEKYGWEFLFLAANIDAVETARKYGIGKDRAVNYRADSRGTRLNYEVLSDAIDAVRGNEVLGENWKERIDQDYEDRK